MEILTSLLALLFNIVLVLLILLIAVVVLLFIYQNSMIYMPAFAGSPQSPAQNMVGLRNPADRKLPYEEVTIKTLDNQVLQGWFIKQPNSKEVPTVIFYHENAGNIGGRLPYLEYYFDQVKVNLLLVAYRGYSDSTGSPTENGLKIDAEAIINFALQNQDINNKRIFIHGRSLGGAVSIYVMTKEVASSIQGVILENTFTSMSDMVDTIFPKLKWFKKFVLRNHWTSIQSIQNINQPILFIFSMKDEIVPVEMMARLENQAKRTKFMEKFVIDSGDHNSNWTQDIHGYFNAISNFIQRAEKN